MDRLKITEIFHSIQGESTWAGFPTVFVRLSGCNLRCTYCDTKYSYEAGEAMAVAKVLERVKSFSTKHVCITGGEPLLQASVYQLITHLCDADYRVSVETSGERDCSLVDPRAKKIIDVKTPHSGAPFSFALENLKFAEDVNTEFKFVICSEDDFSWAENFVRENQLHLKSTVLYSPSFGKVPEIWLAKKILSENSPARLQLQLHKYIWSPDTRSV